MSMPEINSEGPAYLFYIVIINHPRDTVWVEVAGTDDVRQLKSSIERKCGIPHDLQVLVWHGEVLEDPNVIRDCAIPSNSHIHVFDNYIIGT